MRKKPTGTISADSKTDRAKYRSRTGREIREGIASDPEAHPTSADFWKDARVVMPQNKQSVTIRLDADLLDWLRSQKGYQTRINAILRSYMDANRATRR